MYVREVREVDEIPDDESVIREMETSLRAGDVWVLRSTFDREWLLRVREYLAKVATNSLPNYQPILQDAPNFHRVYGDERSYVQGRFHQWSFFPWNLDVFALFEKFAPIYHLNNRINGWPKERYLGLKAEGGCIARLTFQAYPRGGGYIARHLDAAGPHKFTTITVCLSQKGEDYQTGGLYLGRGEGAPDLDVDALLNIGDVTVMHSELEHGVGTIDPEADLDWLAMRGKWTLVMAVNKLADTDEVPNSAQLEYDA
jgi:hypothetical protein